MTQESTARQISVNIPQMGELSGTGCLGPFFGKGTQVDAWAEVIEGMADKAPAVMEAFDRQVNGKQISKTDLRTETLTAAGIVAEKRNYRMIRRAPVLVAVYIAGLGTDLYVSWRLFVNTPIDRLRVMAWLATAAFFALCGFCPALGSLGFARNVGDAATLLFTGLIGFVTGTIFNAVILGIIAAALGFWLTRDVLYLWRSPFTEFHQDDVAALSITAHKSLLNAIDSVGIDIKVLRVKEQFGVQRGRLI